jgi:hypothetical protein
MATVTRCFPRGRLPVQVLLADVTSETSRKALRVAVSAVDTTLVDRAESIATAAGARFVAVAFSTSGGAAVVPLAGFEELVGLGRLLFDLADSLGAVRITRLELDRATLETVLNDLHMLAGPALGEAGRA